MSHAVNRDAALVAAEAVEVISKRCVVVSTCEHLKRFGFEARASASTSPTPHRHGHGTTRVVKPCSELLEMKRGFNSSELSWHTNTH